MFQQPALTRDTYTQSQRRGSSVTGQGAENDGQKLIYSLSFDYKWFSAVHIELQDYLSNMSYPPLPSQHDPQSSASLPFPWLDRRHVLSTVLKRLHLLVD